MKNPFKRTSEPQVIQRQPVPEGYAALPKLRMFRVYRPGDLSDVIVEGTAMGTSDGVLVISEHVYVPNMQTEGEFMMVALTRRMFRVWSDVEEVIGAAPMMTMVVQ